jgi:hypothetical protein
MEPVEQIVELKAELKMEHERAAHESSTQKKAAGETRAADASAGQTKSSSKAPAHLEESKTIHIGDVRKSDEQPIVRANDKKKEILRDD